MANKEQREIDALRAQVAELEGHLDPKVRAERAERHATDLASQLDTIHAELDEIRSAHDQLQAGAAAQEVAQEVAQERKNRIHQLIRDIVETRDVIRKGERWLKQERSSDRDEYEIVGQIWEVRVVPALKGVAERFREEFEMGAEHGFEAEAKMAEDAFGLGQPVTKAEFMGHLVQLELGLNRLAGGLGLSLI